MITNNMQDDISRGNYNKWKKIYSKTDDYTPYFQRKEEIMKCSNNERVEFCFDLFMKESKV
jgi:hypothetical protein